MTLATTHPPETKIAAFIERLHELAKDEHRGALAALRRSLQDPNGMAASACPYVVPYLPGKESVRRDAAYFLVGALFALHSEPGGDGVSMGHAFRRMNDKQEGVGKPDNESLKGRFVALLDAPGEDLPEHLRHAVSLLRSKSVPLDWERLLKDILHWEDEKRYVQGRWARDFWNTDHDKLNSEGEASQ